MELTNVTNLAIETIFWAFVTLIIFDFVDGLFKLWHNQTLVPVTATPHFEPVPLTEHELIAVTPQFEQIPNPWEMELELQPQAVETQSVVLPFPTLKLLSPAKVQHKSKRTRNSNKSADNAKSKSTLPQSQGKPKRPRQKAA
ncbi:hypothetical protein A6770_36735 [Nostoc minutum NIES-26]|uniref:Uncharacterized protein n=1 Tax=Nostoc minutum NIES-26 TaxID=1844469 RepID=A0A367RWK8_9NOSO|nr:hypothetical protein A6770_36735 [Nostoc minutum NIES-26]